MKSTPQVLVVADAPDADALCKALRALGLQAQAAGDGAAAHACLATQRIDLVVVDQALRHVDGLALTRALQESRRMPVILIGGAGSGAIERVIGLEMGADDWVERPLLARELAARIRAVLYRTGLALPACNGRIRFDGWELRRRERSLRSPAGVPVALSGAECQLLAALLRQPRHPVSRDELAARVGCEAASAGRGVDLLVSRLRRKLAADAGHAPTIRSVRGIGYRVEVQSVDGAV